MFMPGKGAVRDSSSLAELCGFYLSSWFTAGSNSGHFLQRIVNGERRGFLTWREILERLSELSRKRRTGKRHVALGEDPIPIGIRSDILNP